MWISTWRVAFLGFFCSCVVALFLAVPPVWKLSQGHPIQIAGYSSRIGPSQADWLPSSQISKHLVLAVIAAEDARFLEHWGVDFQAITSSALLNLRQGEIVRGGSTITQQLVRTLFLKPQKSISRKLREALGALVLEQLITKQDIIIWYLNSVPFGNGIRGVKQASMYYFNEQAQFLTIQRSVQLALILPNPRLRSVDIERRELSEFNQIRYKRIIEQMFNYGYITSSLKDQALRDGNFGLPLP